jgi:hypothetical protein
MKFVPGMLSAAVGAGVYGIMTAMSYDQATKAEKELERKRRIGRELELEMKKISLALEGLKDEEDRLVGFSHCVFAAHPC